MARTTPEEAFAEARDAMKRGDHDGDSHTTRSRFQLTVDHDLFWASSPEEPGDSSHLPEILANDRFAIHADLDTSIAD